MKSPNPRFVFVSLVALSAVLPMSRANADVAYSARFTFQKEPMKLVIHREASGSSAQILTAAGAVQARCKFKNVERDESQKPVVVDMECKSAQFSPLVRQASLFWPNGAGSSSPALRFGTWLEGYEQVRLSVDVDRYSRVVNRAPSVVNKQSSRFKPITFRKVAQN